MGNLFFIEDKIPLCFVRISGAAPVTGLTVAATAKNVLTGATLLSATTLTEAVSGSGIYVYNWTHGLTQQAEVLVTYTVNGVQAFAEVITIEDNYSDVGRAT